MTAILSKIWSLLSRFILWCFNLILKPFGKKMSSSQEESLLQFCKFGIIGVSNTLISLIINWIILAILGTAGLFPNADKYIGNTVAFFLSVLWSYYWNNKYVFKEDENAKKRVWWKTLIKTYLSYAFTGLVLSNVVSYVCVDILHINKFIAPLINLVISVPINYIMNKFWAYGQKKGDKDESEDQPA